MKHYNIPIKYNADTLRESNDHDQRIYLARASDYMPHLDPMEGMAELYEKNKVHKPLKQFFLRKYLA